MTAPGGLMPAIHDNRQQTQTNSRSFFCEGLLSVVCCLGSVLLSSCGYHFTGEYVGLPADVRSISIGRINNQSREYGLEKTLAFALEREIVIRRQLHLEEEAGAADGLLSGTIRDVRVRPVGFNPNDQAVQYEVVLVLDLALTRRTDGKLLWQTRRLQEIDEYAASGTVVVTSSSQFQQDNLNAKDLENPQFASRDDSRPVSIQLAETERRQALERLVQQAVRDVYNQMIEDF